MRDVFLSCSGMSKEDKKTIKEKLQLMGGQYSDTLLENNTHLVTNSVMTLKFKVQKLLS